MDDYDSTERLKGEPRKSNRRLKLYVDFEGTLSDFEIFLKEKHKDIAVSLSQLQKDSSKWSWQSRKEEYQLQREEVTRQIMKNRFLDLNGIGVYDMSKFLVEITYIKEDVMERYNAGDMSIGSVFRLLRDYVKMYRAATEIYYINTRHQLLPNEDLIKDSEPMSPAARNFLSIMRDMRDEIKAKE